MPQSRCQGDCVKHLAPRLILILLASAMTDYAVSSDELKAGAGSEIVSQTCIPCHSLKLVTQNRADRQGWLSMIRWMQEKHGLWELGTLETPILDYLEKHYSPKESGRRPPIAGHLLPKLDVP